MYDLLSFPKLFQSRYTGEHLNPLTEANESSNLDKYSLVSPL